MDHKIVKKGNAVATQVFVQWDSLLHEEAIWEDYTFMKSQFPNFDP